MLSSIRKSPLLVSNLCLARASFSVVALSLLLGGSMPALADYQNPAFERGMARMQHNDFDGAMDAFGEAIGLNDTNPKNYLMRGQCFFKLHNYAMAIQDFNKSLEYAPNDSQAYLWRGTAHANLGKDDFAVKDYEQAIRLDPSLANQFFSPQASDPETHGRGQILMRNGRSQIVGTQGNYENKGLNQNAIADYKQAMAILYPGRTNNAVADEHRNDQVASAAGANEAGLKFEHGGQERNAEGSLHRRMRAVQDNPSADSHVDSLNNSDVSSDASLKGRRNLRVVHSLDTDPNRGDFGPVPGSREFRGDPQKTINNMNEAIANDSSNPESYFKRAKAYQKVMNVGRALSDYDNAIQYGANQSKYYIGRASLFHQLDKPALVKADIERARRCDPDLPQNVSFQGDLFPASVRRAASVPDEN
jgi:tetratricopeptide (TPR) repeat protein